ncbi:MAG: class I SAM-dependent rRNA methyltransferase [Candidatus Coatesbacteria bacterium]
MVRLNAGARRQAGHPWIFDGEVASIDPAPESGALVRVVGARGEAVGTGFWSPGSRARVRLLVEGAEEVPDLEALLRARLAAAVAMRAALGRAAPDGAARIVFGESDGLPGLVADRYGAVVVIQLGSAGMDARRDTIVALLGELLAPGAIVERSDSGGREREGLAPARGLRAGSLPPGGLVPFTAGGLDLVADVLAGQKTGFYLDQRDSWEALRPLGSGRRILDACCYTGAFGLSLLKGGGEALTGIDSSQRAVEFAREAAARNGLAERSTFLHGDAGETMAALRASGERFGFVVLDPSAFAKARAHAGMARRAYATLNELALGLVSPGGFLYSCSCTPWVGVSGLAGIANAAARSAGRRIRLVEVRGASRDHPPHAAMPETAYLAGTLWYVD